MIEIKDRWTGAVIFRSESATNFREALEEAVKSGARLIGARLDGASLIGASLDRASLIGASLIGARLDRASLDRASLIGASLDRASLDRASLIGASLDRARLEPIRDDIHSILDLAPAEVPALLTALHDGRVNGSIYEGPCACLLGTIANARGCAYTALGIAPDSSRAAECWFLGIGEGDTPANNQVSRITVMWIEQWLAKRTEKEVTT